MGVTSPDFEYSGGLGDGVGVGGVPSPSHHAREGESLGLPRPCMSSLEPAQSFLSSASLLASFWYFPATDIFSLFGI